MLTALPVILHFLFPKVVTIEVMTSISFVFGSLGLIASKDANVQGVGEYAQTKKEIEKEGLNDANKAVIASLADEPKNP